MFLNSLEMKVGVLFLIGAVTAGALSLKVSKHISFESSNTYWFVIDHAGGLVQDSGIKVAGINVGKITNISLENGQAKVSFDIRKKIRVTETSFVRVRSQGILGDRHVNVILGDTSGELLPSGTSLRVENLESLSMEGALQNLSEGLSEFSDLAKTLKKSIVNDDSTSLGRFILNMEKLSENLNKVVDKDADKISEIVDNLHVVSKSLKGFLNQNNVSKFKNGIESASESLESIDGSLENLEEFTDKLNSGDGTISQLVNNADTADKINDTLDQVSNFLGGGSQFYADLDFHTEYLSKDKAYKSYAGIKLQPGLDRHYELHVIRDSRGSASSKRTIVRNTETNDVITDEIETNVEDKLKFTFLISKNFYNLSLKGGVIENKSGVAIDLHSRDKRTLVGIEAFGVPSLSLKSYLKYSFFRGVYVMGGAGFSDGLELKNPFVGFGISLRNDDWKFLGSKVSL